MSTNDPRAASPREADSGPIAEPARAKYAQPQLKRLDLTETEGAGTTGPPDGAFRLFSGN